MDWRSNQHNGTSDMKFLRAFPAAIIAMQMTISACEAAANACANAVKLRDDLVPCVEQVAESATKAGLETQRTRNTFFIWVKDDVIVARCVGGIDTVVVMVAYVGGKEEGACILLDRLLNVLPGFTVD
jgi:hypothetical protein